MKCPKHKVSDREPPLGGVRLESIPRRRPMELQADLAVAAAHAGARATYSRASAPRRKA